MLRARVIAPHLHSAAAAVHAAPAPGAVPAVVVEEPPAVVAPGALADARQVAAREELERGGGDGPEDAAQVVPALPRPVEAAVRAGEGGEAGRVEVLVLDRPQVVARRLVAAGDRPKGRVDRGPQPKRALEDGVRGLGIRLGEREQPVRRRLVELSRVAGPADEVGIAAQEVVRLPERVLDRVREMEAEAPAEQAREVLDRPQLRNGGLILPSKVGLRSKKDGKVRRG
jgi:hypothetical protein